MGTHADAGRSRRGTGPPGSSRGGPRRSWRRCRSPRGRRRRGPPPPFTCRLLKERFAVPACNKEPPDWSVRGSLATRASTRLLWPCASQQRPVLAVPYAAVSRPAGRYLAISTPVVVGVTSTRRSVADGLSWGNSRRPDPSTRGWMSRRYSSTRSRRCSDSTSSAPHHGPVVVQSLLELGGGVPLEQCGVDPGHGETTGAAGVQ